jgi:hypothetical protein
LLQHPNGRPQVSLNEVQVTEVAVGNDGCVSAADQCGEAQRLLPVTSTLGEVPEVAQDPRQPRLGLNPQAYAGRARLPVRRLHAAPQQFGRLSEVTRRPICVPQGIGCVCLHGALAEFGRQIEGLPARRNGAIKIARDPEDSGHLGQHPSQSSPIVKRSRQGLGLAQ